MNSPKYPDLTSRSFSATLMPKLVQKFQDIVGKYPAHKRISTNGERLIQLAVTSHSFRALSRKSGPVSRQIHLLVNLKSINSPSLPPSKRNPKLSASPQMSCPITNFQN